MTRSTTARHRAPAPPRAALRRTGHVTLAGAAAVATVGLTAPAAQAHGHNVWDRVAECESSGNWHINTGNGFYGGLQFWHPTWTSFGGQEFAAYAHQATKLQQITVAQRVLQVQGTGAWPVCSVRAGLTLENGSQPYPGEEPAPTPPGESGTWWVSASAGANIRSGPGTGYAVIGGAGHGTQVTGTASNGWVKLASNRWISLTTLTTSNPGGPAPAPTPPGDTATWRVTATVGANIRSGPGTGYAVIGGAGHGTQVQGTLASNGWVELAGRDGWIYAGILTKVG